MWPNKSWQRTKEPRVSGCAAVLGSGARRGAARALPIGGGGRATENAWPERDGAVSARAAHVRRRPRPLSPRRLRTRENARARTSGRAARASARPPRDPHARRRAAELPRGVVAAVGVGARRGARRRRSEGARGARRARQAVGDLSVRGRHARAQDGWRIPRVGTRQTLEHSSVVEPGTVLQSDVPRRRCVRTKKRIDPLGLRCVCLCSLAHSSAPSLTHAHAPIQLEVKRWPTSS